MECHKHQVLFLTSVNFQLDTLRDETIARVNNAKPIEDFTLIPISSSTERLVIFCVTHLLVEAKLLEEDELNIDAPVCSMSEIGSTICNFFNVSYTFTQNELLRE